MSWSISRPRASISAADVPPLEIALHHPRGSAGVFNADRGASVAGDGGGVRSLGDAQVRQRRRQLLGLISAGGSGATALATPAMRALPVGVPKIMISTVASGDRGPMSAPPTS